MTLTKFETTEETIARLEDKGSLDPEYLSCQREHYPSLRKGEWPFAPNHRPNAHCRSGKRPHCTCDACF